MKKVIAMFVISTLTLAGINVEAKNALTVETANPVVVKTFPQAGAADVDPNIKEIKVTFSKDMMTNKMWSWVMISQESFPEITGEVKYLNDKRTCVAPVSLEPNKTYAIWLNSQRYGNFKDTNKRSAIPYLLVFKTKK